MKLSRCSSVVGRPTGARGSSARSRKKRCGACRRLRPRRGASSSWRRTRGSSPASSRASFVKRSRLFSTSEWSVSSARVRDLVCRFQRAAAHRTERVERRAAPRLRAGQLHAMIVGVSAGRRRRPPPSAGQGDGNGVEGSVSRERLGACCGELDGEREIIEASAEFRDLGGRFQPRGSRKSRRLRRKRVEATDVDFPLYRRSSRLFTGRVEVQAASTGAESPVHRRSPVPGFEEEERLPLADVVMRGRPSRRAPARSSLFQARFAEGREPDPENARLV